MPNFPEQYFNQDTAAKTFTEQNKVVTKEIEVSGSSTDKIYYATLVKLTGTDTINLQTGDVNIKLDHTGTNYDSTRIGDGTNLLTINPDSSAKVSGATTIVDVNGANIAKVTTGGMLLVSGITTSDITHLDDSIKIGDGVDLWAINPDGSGKISGTTIIYDTNGNSANIVSSHLKISGLTQIEAGETFIGSVGGKSKKPQITFTRQANTTTYSILDSINSGTTVMERFIIARINSGTTWCTGGQMSISTSASTSLNCDCHIFSSGLTVTTDNTLWEPNVNEGKYHLGVLSFSSPKVLGNRSFYSASVESPFVLTPDPDNPLSVWGELIARNAYVPPSNSEQISVSLDIDQN